jgi:hypothetical protein
LPHTRYCAIHPSPCYIPIRMLPPTMLLPLTVSQLDDLEPETEPHLLRCDLFEAVGWSLPPASALYLVLAWGPTERKSKSNTPAAGKIIFESPLVSKTGYAEP